MFTNKDVNTLKAMFYAASCTNGITDLRHYSSEYDKALERYFNSFPNEEYSNEAFTAGDVPYLED